MEPMQPPFYLFYNNDIHSGHENKYDDIAKVFKKWSKSDLNSYLLEISSTKLLEKTDGNFLLDIIDDKADDNGTGRWMLK